jgi:glycosyltransferase involved in cell wall biosynthesis
MDLNTNRAISALIITLNEEIHMRELLTDLQFVDEVIVVDSFSTDGTKSISSEFANVKFIENRFENYTAQRNFAISQAKNDWILFLDADERLTPELKAEILQTVQLEKPDNAYLFYRKFMFKQAVLHFSGWQTDRIFRLFNKHYAKYTTERLVHEKLDVDGSIGLLKHKLIHFSYSDYNSYKMKMSQYGKLKALEKFNKKVKPGLGFHVLHPTYNFLYNYLIRLGFLDGLKGIVICYLNAYSIYIRYQKLDELWRNAVISKT